MRLAAIDIGSNAMRLLINDVIELNGKAHFVKLDCSAYRSVLDGTFLMTEKSVTTISNGLSQHFLPTKTLSMPTK